MDLLNTDINILNENITKETQAEEWKTPTPNRKWSRVCGMKRQPTRKTKEDVKSDTFFSFPNFRSQIILFLQLDPLTSTVWLCFLWSYISLFIVSDHHGSYVWSYWFRVQSRKPEMKAEKRGTNWKNPSYARDSDVLRASPLPRGTSGVSLRIMTYSLILGHLPLDLIYNINIYLMLFLMRLGASMFILIKFA